MQPAEVAGRQGLSSAQGLEALALRSFACGLNWITSKLDSFVPSSFTNPDAMKECTELALLYCLVCTWQVEIAGDTLSRIRDFLCRLFSSRELAEWLRKSPAHYSPSAIGYLALRATGERIGCFEYTLKRLHSGGFPDCLEIEPYREIELKYMLWKSGLRRSRPGLERSFRATTLGRGGNPIYLSNSEVYSITHTLLYLTDFAGPCTNFHEDERLNAIEITRALLTHFWRMQDWDLTSELLLNLVALDCADDRCFASAFRAVSSALRPDGAVPGPHFSASHPESKDDTWIFKQCYHTTLVSLLLWGGYLYRRRRCH